MQPRWPLHFWILGGLGFVGVTLAFALGTNHPHGLFTPAFFLAVVFGFWSVHAASSSLLVWKWGRTKARVVAFHAGLLVSVPTVFGVIASIVS